MKYGTVQLLKIKLLAGSNAITFPVLISKDSKIRMLEI